MNLPANDLSISDRLREVYERTDSREYAEALDVLEATRSTDPGNIYISALKRQLETLLSLSQDDDLSEDRRKELMEPMPGIIECAVRDNQRQSRTGTTESPRTQPVRSPLGGSAPSSPHGMEGAADRPVDTGDPQKELEALKLLYFQRASKFVMKGEYEQALAEVRRVFIVDPENIIAKEYASRVEQLLQHARRLASEPLAPELLTSPDVPEESPQDSQEEPAPEPEEPVRVNAEDTVHVHTQRSTAWDEEFIAPKPAEKIPAHRPTPPSSRMTVAYGDSLAVSHQRVREEPAEEEHEKPGRSKSKFFIVLGTVILTPILAGIAVAVFSPKSAEATGHGIVPVQQSQTQNSNTSAEGTIGTPVQPAPETAAPKVDESQTAAATPAVKTPPLVQEQKPKSEPVQVKSEILQKPVASEPPKTELAKADLPKADPPKVDPPKSDPPKAEPQLIASAATAAKPPVEEPAFVPVEKPPQIIRLEKPEFPGFLREGQVVVRVRIDANGKATDTQILKSSNPLFEQPVIDAVMKSQFSPAQMGQGPVAAWFIIPFRFKQ